MFAALAKTLLTANRALILLCIVAAAKGVDAAEQLDVITITATRVATPGFEVAASIASLPLQHDALGVNVSESLAMVPGLVARDRQNYAQDTQISIRGFGARSAFGIRGVRLYIDGIPATQPDGQGQVSHFNLATAERVEVLRGPFSALYGNSSGGVIQLFTADGRGRPTVEVGTADGSFETWRVNLGAQGKLGDVDFNAGYLHFATDGSRGHAAARRDSAQAKLGWDTHGNRLTLLVNHLNAPDAQDPLGLTQSQYQADSRQSAPAALQFNTRKSARQSQVGLIYDWTVSHTQRLRLQGYAGDRAVQQFLAIPAATQADPRHSGGVVDLRTQFSGGEVRWQGDASMAERTLRWTIGVDYDSLVQWRRGYENFVGSMLGVQGALRRDERDSVRAFDQYLQADWTLTRRWQLTGGVRYSHIYFHSQDAYVRAGNPDDSGGVDYAAISPVYGLMYRATPELHLYASYGRGFETPTFAELAYRPDGNAGLNFGLLPSRSNIYELGGKWRAADGLDIDVALFDARSQRELVVISNAGGRSAYGNAGRTRRRGAELSATTQLSSAWRVQLAYTAMQATVKDDYLTCTAVPCLTPTTRVPSASRMPGVPQLQLNAQLEWRHFSGWYATLDGRHVGSVLANDQNSARADGYTLLNAVIGYAHRNGSSEWQIFLRADNLSDRQYIGSVIVNEANSRFFEPAAGRNWLGGVRVIFGG